MPETKPVLLIDDEPEILAALGETLMLDGYSVRAEGNAVAAIAAITADYAGAVISDLRMPGLDGLGVLARLKEIDPRIPLIIVTGHAEVAKAVEAMRLGAFDFIEKPVEPEHLLAVVGKALDMRRLVLENRRLAAKARPGEDIESIIVGRSAEITAMRDQVLAIASADADTLILGETGTGKELVARCLHDFGPRAAAPFVALNCGALPETIIASELFGHEAGAFTGAVKRRIGKLEHASGGTVFLDEIESLPLHLQTQFLRALQERVIERVGSNVPVRVDFRVIAATKVDLRRAADEGRFREDLLYRLNLAEIVIPPLRERREDVPLLFQYFVARSAASRGKEPPAIPPAMLAQLATDPWRGNVRELRNRAERFALGLHAPVPGTAGRGQGGGAGSGRPASLTEQLDGFERAVILQAIAEAKGNISATARVLGMPRKRLYLRMQKLGIMPKRSEDRRPRA